MIDCVVVDDSQLNDETLFTKPMDRTVQPLLIYVARGQRGGGGHRDDGGGGVMWSRQGEGVIE